MPYDALDRLERLFHAARLHPVAERAAFLAAACADDPALQRELAALLEADALAEGDALLDVPAAGVAAEAVGPDAPALLPDSQVGPYKVLRRIGAGGMGDVYLAAREVPFKYFVALKVIRRGMDTEDVLRRFGMERQILASLNHPNIARLLDGGATVEGLPYFAMEYVEGLPLTTYCDTHRLGIAERLALFRTACQAVHYAHQNLVIHRDLKPSNILVTENGMVKLLDFGIAKLLNPNLSPLAMPVTQMERPLMTPGYASPEQVRGEALTTASDVYSLGVILYELLTGHRPYRLTRQAPEELVRVVCEQEPERPSTKVTRVEEITCPEGQQEKITPEQVGKARNISVDRLRRRLRGDLDNIVLMALRKEATRRYASAEQLNEDLARYLAGQPVTAHRDTRRYRVKKFIRRHRAETGAAVLVVVALLGTLFTTFWHTERTARERDRAEQALAQSETVTTFLMELFEASDPSEAKGDEATASELLERGVERAEALHTQPLLQAAMLDAIGRVYQSLGQFETAQNLLERALYLRRTRLGDEHPLVAESMTHLGAVLTRRGDYVAAVSLLRDALSIQRKQLPDPHEDIAAILLELGYVLPFEGRWGEAEAAYRDVLEMRRALVGPEHPHVAAVMIRLASVLRAQGRYDEAEVLFREALAMHRRVQGERHPDVAWSMFQLAILLEMKQEHEEAEALLRRSVDLQRALEGEMDPQVSSYLFELGSVLQARGQDEEAETVLRRALALRQQVLKEHPSTADGLLFLATFLHEKGRLDEARAFYQEALSMRRTLLGHTHQEVAVVLAGLGRLQADEGRYQEAETLLQRALAMHRKVNGPDHHHVGESLAGLARLHRRMGLLAQADSLYQEALTVLRKSHREEHVAVQQIYADMADLYEAWGKRSLADQYRARRAPPDAAGRP